MTCKALRAVYVIPYFSSDEALPYSPAAASVRALKIDDEDSSRVLREVQEELFG